MKKYLVIAINRVTNEKQAFFTDWHSPEFHGAEFDIIVIDLRHDRVSFDGESWEDIEEDYL